MTKISAMSKILIVEDDPDIRELLRFNLEKAGYTLFLAEDGEKALTLARKHSPDIILLDLMLPGVDGLEVCRTLKKDPELQRHPHHYGNRQGGGDGPGGGPGTRGRGLRGQTLQPPGSSAADPKDTGPKGKASGPSHFESGPLWSWIWTPTPPVWMINYLELTATEFRLLTHLLRHRGRVQTREMLLDRVWGYSFEGYARTIDTHIRRVRKKWERPKT